MSFEELKSYCNDVEKFVRELIIYLAKKGEKIIDTEIAMKYFKEICGEEIDWFDIAETLLKLKHKGLLFGGIGYGGRYGIKTNVLILGKNLKVN